MIYILKELLIVLLIAAIVFRVARPIALKFISAQDFARRRRFWFALTVLGFLSPSFPIYVILAIPILLIAGRRDPNPVALYLMLLVVVPPTSSWKVPMVGMPYLFLLDYPLILSFCVMTPLAWRALKSPATESRLTSSDLLLLAYGVLGSFYYAHTQAPDGTLYPGSATESLRRTFIFFFSIFVPFFAIRRTITSDDRLREAIATYCLNCAVLIGISIFESSTRWLLYADMASRWGGALLYQLYLTRGQSLRALASAGHSMSLGYLIVVSFGFWLYAQRRVASSLGRATGNVAHWAGLFAAYTRGAWIGGVLVYFFYALLSPRAMTKFSKSLFVAAGVAGLIYVSPLGDRIVSVLPFLGGTVDKFNVDYRQRLLDRSWEIVKNSPLLGDPEAMLKLQDLRQGEGIVDLVNTYIGILLNCGFVGLALFVGFILLALRRAITTSRRYRRLDEDFSLLGASVASCILAMLALLADSSLGGATQALFFALAAFATAYGRLGDLKQGLPDAQHRPALEGVTGAYERRLQ